MVGCIGEDLPALWLRGALDRGSGSIRLQRPRLRHRLIIRPAGSRKAVARAVYVRRPLKPAGYDKPLLFHVLSAVVTCAVASVPWSVIPAYGSLAIGANGVAAAQARRQQCTDTPDRSSLYLHGSHRSGRDAGCRCPCRCAMSPATNRRYARSSSAYHPRSPSESRRTCFDRSAFNEPALF